jgi:hypothetical protein
MLDEEALKPGFLHWFVAQNMHKHEKERPDREMHKQEQVKARTRTYISNVPLCKSSKNSFASWRALSFLLKYMK